MAGVYVVTGKLGNGKSLVTVARIYEAIQRGAVIATNIDLNLVAMFGRKARDINVIRIPDKPTIHDLEMIGQGYYGKYDESKFGVLALDECGTWFNSRNWQDKARMPVNNWFLHGRKLRWEMYILVQNESVIDSQFRETCAEYLVTCTRLDNIRLPIIGGLVKMLTGIRLTLPRIHSARVIYTAVDMLADKWVYRGNHMFSWYRTDQIFSPTYAHGPHCLLTPWHTHGRYAVELTTENIMRITRIYWRRFRSPVALATGLLLGAFAMLLNHSPTAQAVQSVQVETVQPSQSAEPVVNPLIDRLQRMHITGAMKVNGWYRYSFSDDPEKPTVYSSLDLANAGVVFKHYGPCRVDALYADQQITLYCM